MPPSVIRSIGTVLVVALLGAWAYNSWIVQPENRTQQHALDTQERVAAAQRFKEWAYVAKEKEVAAGETIKLVIIPSNDGIEMFDIKCLIYTNREFKTSSMICPDAERHQLAENAQ